MIKFTSYAINNHVKTNAKSIYYNDSGFYNLQSHSSETVQV